MQSAAARLAGKAHVTPVVTSRSLDEACGAHVFLKCENLQRVGAFKFRGAYNAIRGSRRGRARGVVASRRATTRRRWRRRPAARRAGDDRDADDGAGIKRAATEAFGARSPHDPETESREAVAAAFSTNEV